MCRRPCSRASPQREAAQRRSRRGRLRSGRQLSGRLRRGRLCRGRLCRGRQLSGRLRSGRLCRGRLRRGRQPSALFPSPAPAPRLTSVAGGTRRSERRAPMLRPLPVGSKGPKGGRRCSVRRRRNPKFRKAGANAPSLPVGPVGPRTGRRLPPSGRVFAGKCPCGSVLHRECPCGNALRREPPCRSVLRRERPCGRVLAGAPVREGSRGSARAGEFPRKRPGCAPKAPRVCPGSYCFDFGCAERWLSSSSAASSAR